MTGDGPGRAEPNQAKKRGNRNPNRNGSQRQQRGHYEGESRTRREGRRRGKRSLNRTRALKLGQAKFVARMGLESVGRLEFAGHLLCQVRRKTTCPVDPD